MAKQTIISSSVASPMCQVIIDALGAGSTLNIYAGTIPTDLASPLTTQNILVEILLPSPAFGAIVDSVTRATTSIVAVVAAEATAAGLATFFRACNSLGNPVLQGTVGMLDCDLNLSSTNFAVGVSVRVTSWNIHISKNQTVC